MPIQERVTVNMPKIVLLLGYCGLLPFLLGPAWLQLAPETAPAWLDHAWLSWIALIAAFMAGTFWGFALPAAQGPEGVVGIILATTMMILTWAVTLLDFPWQLAGFALVFLLLLLADLWRERTLDTIGGYFRLRSALTAGVIVAISWRFAIGLQ